MSDGKKVIFKTRSDVISGQTVSIYARNGKFYWNIKSVAFDTPKQAFDDAAILCRGIKAEERNQNGR